MIAQGAMAFNSQRSPKASPFGVPQMLVTLKLFVAKATLAFRERCKPNALMIGVRTVQRGKFFAKAGQREPSLA